MTDKNKANIADLLAYAMTQSNKAETEKQAKELANGLKTMYDAFRAEGFTERESMHFIDMILSGAIMGGKK